MNIVNQSLTGFLPIMKFINRGQRAKNLTFRDGSRVTCRSRFEAFNLCMHYYVTNRVGIYSSEEIREIQSLSNLLNDAMRDVFTDDEISTCATGAPAYFSPTLMVLYALI